MSCNKLLTKVGLPLIFNLTDIISTVCVFYVIFPNYFFVLSILCEKIIEAHCQLRFIAIEQ